MIIAKDCGVAKLRKSRQLDLGLAIDIINFLFKCLILNKIDNDFNAEDLADDVEIECFEFEKEHVVKVKFGCFPL